MPGLGNRESRPGPLQECLEQDDKRTHLLCFRASLFKGNNSYETVKSNEKSVAKADYRRRQCGRVSCSRGVWTILFRHEVSLCKIKPDRTDQCRFFRREPGNKRPPLSPTERSCPLASSPRQRKRREARSMYTQNRVRRPYRLQTS
jgi:hypothetical protein